MSHLHYIYFTLLLLFATYPVSAGQPNDAQYAPGYLGVTFTRGSTLHSANGFFFDSNDRIHLANLVSHEIHTINPRTGYVHATIGTDAGVFTPDDIVVDSDDSVYWTSILSGQVGRQNTDGTTEIVAQLTPGVNGITFSRMGLLYVGNYNSGEIYELDPRGQGPTRVVATLPPGLEGMDFGPDGFLYVPSLATGTVTRVDVITGAAETVLENYRGLSSLKFDRLGNLFVVQSSGNVLLVNPENKTARVFARIKTLVESLAFDSRNNMYVSDGASGHLYRIYGNGRYRSIFRGGVIAGGGIGLHNSKGTKSLFVADTFSLKRYDMRGRLVDTTLYGASNPFTELQPMSTVTAFGSDVLVTSWFGNAVQIWNPDKKKMVESYLDFALPTNAIDADGKIVVAELLTGSVVMRTPGTNERTELAHGLFVPLGLAADNGNIWVSDWASGVVWQIAAAGQALADPLPVAGGLAFPEGMALDRDGNLIVVETGQQRLVKINTATGEMTTIASNLPIGIPPAPDAPPYWIVNGVTVDDAGTIYLSLDQDNKILKIFAF